MDYHLGARDGTSVIHEWRSGGRVAGGSSRSFGGLGGIGDYDWLELFSTDFGRNYPLAYHRRYL